MNKDYIRTESEFLGAIGYRIGSSDGESDWFMLKNEIERRLMKFQNEQEVADIASFLIVNPDHGNDNEIVQCIRKIYDSDYDFEMLNKAEKGIESCPTEDAKRYYLRGGNKRSIALTMKLLLKKIKFIPVKITDWREEYTRADSDNLADRPTTHGC